MKSLRLVLSLTVAALIGGFIAVGHAEDGVTKDEIKIGSFGPLAGPVYMYGKLAMNGLEALFDKVNQEGGVHGRKLKLVREDDACKPEGGIAAVKKLIYDDKVFAINGGGCSNSTLAARPEIAKAGIPFVVNSAVADGISSPPAPNIFTTQLTATIESRAQLKYALEQKALAMGQKPARRVTRPNGPTPVRYALSMPHPNAVGDQVAHSEVATSVPAIR